MTTLRVGFLGGGHINGVLRATVGQSRPYRAVATVGRDDPLPEAGSVDVVVEAATQDAVRERVPALVDRGIDVIVLSIGAFADARVRERCGLGVPRVPERGLAIACTGAIGGLDQVRALRAAGPLVEASIESRKLPATLIQPWMDADLQDALRRGDTEIILADGPASEVAQRFPASANVAAALALAGDAWDVATARVVADPAAIDTRHEIRVRGSLGEIRAVSTNEPSPERPRSSAIVAWAALRALDDYARLRRFDAPADATFL